MSLQQVAHLLGRTRNTVDKWLSQGCPYVKAANRDTGQAWVLDIGEVVSWLEERAAAAVAEKLGDPDVMSKDEADRRRAVAMAGLAELELEEELKAVVKVERVLDEVAAEYAAVRSALEAIPSKLAGRLVNIADPNKIRGEVESSLRHALSSLRKDRADA